MWVRIHGSAPLDYGSGSCSLFFNGFFKMPTNTNIRISLQWYKVHFDVEIKAFIIFLLVGGRSWSVQIITDLDPGGPVTYGSGSRTLRFLHPGAPYRPDFCKPTRFLHPGAPYRPDFCKPTCLNFKKISAYLHLSFYFIFYCSLLRCFEVETTWDAGYSSRTKRTEILLCNLKWNLWKYSFIEVPEHNLEISQTWGFYLSFCLSTKCYSWANLSFLHWLIVLYGFLKP
jgi:hypothetical protein